MSKFSGRKNLVANPSAVCKNGQSEFCVFRRGVAYAFQHAKHSPSKWWGAASGALILANGGLRVYFLDEVENNRDRNEESGAADSERGDSSQALHYDGHDGDDA